MNFRLFEGPRIEPSQLVGFAGNMIDRNSEHRNDDDVAQALAHPESRIMLVRDGRIFMTMKNGAFSADFSISDARAFDAALGEAILLGRDGETPVLIATAGIAPEALPEQIKAIDYRSVYVQELIAPDRLGAMAQGVSLLTWNQTHRFCGRCGGPTRMRDGGYRRTCTGCKTDHFPRTDPVVIMLVLDGDRCLLGRSARFQTGMYSCLAGFLEPGETIEAAVRRETFEESGISVGRVAYHASQPWPFPHTLMIGCYGEALTRELTIDRNELADCRWFARDEIRATLAGDRDQISFPPAGAIATLLIRDWANGNG